MNIVDNIVKQAPFPFAKHASIGCGGEARVAYFPKSEEETIALSDFLRAEGTPYLVLGNLSNVLPSDEGYSGAVVSTKWLRGLSMEKNFAYAGVTSGQLLAAAREAKKTGVEFLKGIPCTLGGALYMNAGVGGRYIAEVVERVLVLREGERLWIDAADCEYDYKRSVFMQNDDIILGATLRLQPSTREQIEERERAYLARRAHLPTGRSMGCVFKNPEGMVAGKLIEGCGLKGLRLGGAKIAEEHANFILNENGGTARDIRALIALIKNAVRAQYGVELREEIRYL